MAAENQFRLRITAVDKASALIKKIGQQAGGIGSKLNLGNKLQSSIAAASSLKLGKLADQAAGFGTAMSKVVTPMNLVASAATVGGLAKAASTWAGLGGDVLTTSRALGVSARDLQTLRGAAELSGVSADKLDASLGSLGTTLNDAANGRNGNALAMLSKLGISIHRTKDGAIDTVQAFKDLSAVMATTKMPIQTRQLIAGTFGVDGAMSLLLKGQKGIDASQKRAAALSRPQSDQELSEAASVLQSRREADLAGKGATNWLGGKLGGLYQGANDLAASALSQSPGATLAGAAAAGMAGKMLAGKAISSLASSMLSPAFESVGKAASQASVASSSASVARSAMGWGARIGGGLGMLLHSDDLNAGENEWVAARHREMQAKQSAPSPGGASGKAGAEDSAALFARLEKQHGLPPGLLDRIWLMESGRGKNMRSPAGALGHFQFMPQTARQYGLKNPFDLGESAESAARMYRDLLQWSGGDVRKALAGYNWGMGNVNRYGMDRLPRETQGYLAKYERLSGGSAPAVPASVGGGLGDDGSPMIALLTDIRDGMKNLGQIKVNASVKLEGTPPGMQASTRVDTGRVYFPMPQALSPT